MRKSLVAVLTAGLLLLGVSPVWAAGQAMAAVPAQQEEVVQVVVPEGSVLGDADLESAQGSFDFFLFTSGVITAVNGFQQAARAAQSNNVAGTLWGMAQFLYGVGQAAFGVFAPL